VNKLLIESCTFFKVVLDVKYLTKKKNTAGSIYNCTAKDVDVTTLFFFPLPWLRFTPPSCFLYGTHVAVTSLFPAKQPYLPNYKTLSRQNGLEFLVEPAVFLLPDF
jgi:hypothetical protein